MMIFILFIKIIFKINYQYVPIIIESPKFIIDILNFEFIMIIIKITIIVIIIE